MPTRQIYLLSPKELPPETIAVAFAKTSRSPESFKQIAAELSEEKSANFHEKWVVGYGHASVAEHAVLHIAIENISRLAVECVESNRLASYTEKSTRYQKWDPDAFFIPPELANHPQRELFTETCRMLFETYDRSLEPTRRMVAAEMKRRKDESEENYDRRIRSQYVDSCRFLLPAASLANVGMTVNARALEHAISKMLSHPLKEVQAIGEEVRQTALQEVPTLVKYANSLPYLVETAADLGNLEIVHGRQADWEGSKDWCTLSSYDPEGELKVLAAALYRFSEMSYQEALDTVRGSGEEQLEKLAEIILGRMGEHDIPLRELEHSTYTFDILLDQGGYAELKRHRMMTQTPQLPTTRLGYATPRRLVEAGFEVPYREAMEAAAQACEALAEHDPQVAAYLVPNGFHRRILATMNLREAFSFCQLRAAPNAHFSMRRLAQRVAAEIRRVHPLLAKYMRLPDEPWQEVEAKHLQQV